MADDLRREARDPGTPPERLRKLLETRRGVDGSLSRADLAVRSAVVRHPALPLELLRQILLDEPRDWSVAAWHHPAVAQLMRDEPQPGYRHAACALLARLGQQRVPGTSLEELVSGWANGDVARESRAPEVRQAHAVARHLAGVFGLPWRSEAT